MGGELLNIEAVVVPVRSAHYEFSWRCDARVDTGGYDFVRVVRPRLIGF